MPSDTPGRDRDASARGLGANDGSDPTLASYLSSLLYALTVPVGLALAYGGYVLGYYDRRLVLPLFGGMVLGAIVTTLLAMHFAST